MDLSTLVKDLTDAKVLLSQKDTEITGLKASATQVVELTAKNTELTTQKAALEAKVATLEATDAVKLAADLATVKAYLHSEDKRLALTLGATPLAETATVSELTSAIAVNRQKVTDALTPKPSTEATLAAVSGKAPINAFKTR